MVFKKGLDHVFGDYADIFDKNKCDKEGLKSNVRVVLTGLGAIGLEKAADIYANMGGAREWLYNNVYAGHDTLLKYASMHGQQELANHVFNIPPGGSTEFYAFVLGGFAAVAAGAYYLKNRSAGSHDKLTRADVVGEIKKKPVSFAFALPGAAGYGADALNGPYHAVTGMASGGKTAVNVSVQPIKSAMFAAASVLPSAAKGTLEDISSSAAKALDDIYDGVKSTFGFGKNKICSACEAVKCKVSHAKNYSPTVETRTVTNPAETRSTIMNMPAYKAVEKQKPASGNGYLWQNGKELNSQLDSMGFFR